MKRLKTNMNKEGLTFLEWRAAANCGGEYVSKEQTLAWETGVDPTEWRSELVKEREARRIKEDALAEMLNLLADTIHNQRILTEHVGITRIAKLDWKPSRAVPAFGW